MSEGENSERCQRCGDAGPDLRTLWQACLYAMEETGLPFEEVRITGHVFEVDHFETKPLWEGARPTRQAVYKDTPNNAEPANWHFYTLRVCKACRADWMSAIRSWFENPPAREYDEEANIPIREMGALRFLTTAEYERLYPGRVPQRIVRSTD